ncbi:MAG: crotonase/enoyl-CoA hydratase family protein [Rhizobiaceae bacterium]
MTDFHKTMRHGAVALVSLNRPERANAMAKAFWREFPALLASLAEDASVRAVVVCGEGRHFTSGMDLGEFQDVAKLFALEPGRAAHAMRAKILELQDAFTAIERVPFPVIAAVHGACIGAGIDMITACDIRLASAEAYFSVEEIHIGMAADVGTLQRLPKLIAPGAAAELAYTGRRFSAEEALRLGLVTGIHADREAVIAAALAMAQDLAQKSPLALAGIKRNLAYARDHSVADGLDYIATWNGGMLRPDDLMKAVAAKMTKQQALFADLHAAENQD